MIIRKRESISKKRATTTVRISTKRSVINGCVKVKVIDVNISIAVHLRVHCALMAIKERERRKSRKSISFLGSTLPPPSYVRNQ